MPSGLKQVCRLQTIDHLAKNSLIIIQCVYDFSPAIITAAMEMLGGKDVANMCRKPEIMSDAGMQGRYLICDCCLTNKEHPSVAAYVILTRDKSFTGNFTIDEAILREEGCTDFDQYAVAPGHELLPDGFIDGVDENAFSMVPGSSKAKGEKAAAAGGSGSGGAGGVANVFKDVEGILNEDLVKKVNAVYAFDVQGKSGVLCFRKTTT